MKTTEWARLQRLSVELPEPALVERSRWYCWFPSLIRQPDGGALVEGTISAVQQGCFGDPS